MRKRAKAASCAPRDLVSLNRDAGTARTAFSNLAFRRRKVAGDAGPRGLIWRAAILLGVHAIFIRWMAEKDTVAVIFAPGPHVPRSEILTAAAFIAVRLATVLLVPGYLAVAALRAALRTPAGR